MKRIGILFLLFALMGCSLIVREEQDIKAIGIGDREAKEAVDLADKKDEDQKIKIWPWGKPIENEK